MNDARRILSGEVLSGTEWSIWVNFCSDKMRRKEEFSFYPLNELPFKKNEIANRAISHLAVCKTQNDVDVTIKSLHLLSFAQLDTSDKNKRAAEDILYWVEVGKEAGLISTSIRSIFGLLVYCDPNGKYHDINRQF